MPSIITATTWIASLGLTLLLGAGCEGGTGSGPDGTGGSASGGSGSGGSAGSGTGGHATGGGATGGKATGGTATGGAATGGAATGGSATGGHNGTGGMVGTGGSGAATGGTSPTGWSAGNPPGTCTAGIPARGKAVDTSTPTAVVGTGTAASCTFTQLQAAATQGGVVTFNCGPDAVTIMVTATLNLPTNKNTVIDGGRKITLDGGKAVQIMRFDHGDFRVNDKGLTLQHIALINGKMTPTVAIPTAPAPCSQGWDDGEGGAIYVRDGALTLIDTIFRDNAAAALGPDTGGGAIYVLGSKPGVMIAGSTFVNNTASNAGAVGALHSELNIYDSLFMGNKAVGHDNNHIDAINCTVMNNDQYEAGSGGNGGAIYSDGSSVNITLCGDAILGNAAGTNAFGGGLFFTSNDMGGTLSIADTTMTGNTGGHWTNVSTGSVKDLGSAVGTNAKSITVSNSTLQDMR